MGPFNTPWSTFSAWIVTGATIVASIVWAILSGRSRGKRG